MFASTTTLQMSTVAINVSTTHLPSCNQREYDPPMCASTDPDVCKQLHLPGVASTRCATVNQPPKSVVREIRTPRSVGTGGGRPPPVTRWALRNGRSYREHS
jgi:hypothetical protein